MNREIQMLKMFPKLPNIVLEHLLPSTNDSALQSLKMKASYNSQRDTVGYPNELNGRHVSFMYIYIHGNASLDFL